MSIEICIETMLDYELAKSKHLEIYLHEINYCWIHETRAGFVAYPYWTSAESCLYLIKKCGYAALGRIELGMSPQEIMDTIQFELKQLGYLDLMNGSEYEVKK